MELALAPVLSVWHRTLALRIITDQGFRVLLAAYRLRLRRSAKYLSARGLPLLGRLLLQHHWSAWAAISGATLAAWIASGPSPALRHATQARRHPTTTLPRARPRAPIYTTSKLNFLLLFRHQETRRLEALLRAAPNYDAWCTLARQLAASERQRRTLRDASSLMPWRRAAARRARLASATAAATRASSIDVVATAAAEEDDIVASGVGPSTFDRELVEERLRLLRASRASGDVGEMMFALRADLLRSLGNVTNLGRSLHSPDYLGVPPLVGQYIVEVRTQLKLVAQETQLRPEEKLAFLQETRHCFGRTALLLSGGGTLGAFHIGVVRALVRQNLLPRVLAGSSVGSVVASIVATRTSDELRELFHDDATFKSFLPDMTFFSGSSLGESVSNYVRTGALHDIAFFQKRLRAILGDITFQDAYDRSGGRILCVAVCATRGGERPRLLNYLTAPHLVIWSAVAASCAFPNLFPPQPLLAKSRGGALVPWQPEGRAGPRLWRDGSLEEDLPMRGLSELFNCNYFIVSQTNPHIVPILRIKRAVCKRSPVWAAMAAFVESEWKHRCRQVRELCPGLDVFGFFSLFGQQWEGDVTVVIPFTAAQLSRVVSNPSREYLYLTALQGERELWPRLGTIDANCGIEVQLDECTRELRAKLHRSVSLSRRGRVPSWNVMTRESFNLLASGGSGSVAPPSLTRGQSEDSNDLRHRSHSGGALSSNGGSGGHLDGILPPSPRRGIA